MDNPTGKATGLLRKKVAGIPVVWVAGAGVAVLAVYAYRTHANTDQSTNQDQQGDTSDDPDSQAAAIDQKYQTSYDQFTTKGSVSAAPPGDTTQEPEVETNTSWLKKGIQWQISKGVSAGVAQSALQTYLSGSNLTYDQAQIRDAVIKEFGLPPDPPDKTNNPDQPKVADVGKAQGPLPRTHIIKGTADNTYAKIATLYYPSGDTASVTLLANANRTKLTGSGPWKVGTGVYVPKYSVPKYYTSTKKTDTLKEIAAKNGVSQASVRALNPGMKFPVKSGTRVRVG